MLGSMRQRTTCCPSWLRGVMRSTWISERIFVS
jgi:hypothetical protein